MTSRLRCGAGLLLTRRLAPRCLARTLMRRIVWKPTLPSTITLLAVTACGREIGFLARDRRRARLCPTAVLTWKPLSRRHC
ncbi:MAG: hypothetical protein K2X31_07870, partial [Sphingopyxis sp.]|nr:hypothetical protein [Sphingopyxis sp.]